jgi:hypothetical protein
MSRYVIHINQAVLKRNLKTGEREPAVTFKKKSGGRATTAHQVSMRDATGRELGRVVCSIDKPLKCGARAWVETAFLDLWPLGLNGELVSIPVHAEKRAVCIPIGAILPKHVAIATELVNTLGTEATLDLICTLGGK